MQLLTKKSIWILLLVMSVLLLGAYSLSTLVPPSTKPSKAAPTLQPTDIRAATTIETTETQVALPKETLITEETATSTPAPTEAISDLILADVLSIEVSGSENAFQFSVEILSPDTGCEQYANWWEVVTEDGKLIYRRILGHSHVSEQPFTRSGGPVAIGADTVVIIRAHMHPDGYGGAAFRGSVQDGFEEIQLEADFAPDLEITDPLPDGCAF